MIREDNRKKLTFIDLFVSCGGLSEGFLASGHFEGLAHIEWEKPMVETLRHRLTSFWNHTTEDALRRVIHFDVQQTDALINGTDDGSFSGYGKNNHPDITRHGLNGLIGDQQVDLIIGGLRARPTQLREGLRIRIPCVMTTAIIFLKVLSKLLINLNLVLLFSKMCLVFSLPVPGTFRLLSEYFPHSEK